MRNRILIWVLLYKETLIGRLVDAFGIASSECFSHQLYISSMPITETAMLSAPPPPQIGRLVDEFGITSCLSASDVSLNSNTKQIQKYKYKYKMQIQIQNTNIKYKFCSGGPCSLSYLFNTRPPPLCSPGIQHNSDEKVMNFWTSFFFGGWGGDISLSTIYIRLT